MKQATLLDESPKPMLIDGRQVSTANDPLVSVNPARGAINHAICAAGPDEVDLAVQYVCTSGGASGLA